MKSRHKNLAKKWLISLTLLGVLWFVVYLNQLDNLIKDTFSKPLSSPYSTKPLAQHPTQLLNMLLLVEDQSFFIHPGVDFKEIVRVFRDYWLEDKPIRGASTLTQQLIKNTLLTRERLLGRKLKEMLMALLLEASFDKNFILNYYVNSVYLGQKGNLTINGFSQGAQFYFNKKVENLSLKEMATLVALVKGPSYYHFIKHSQRLEKRTELVLNLHHKYKKIVK